MPTRIQLLDPTLNPMIYIARVWLALGFFFLSFRLPSLIGFWFYEAWTPGGFSGWLGDALQRLLSRPNASSVYLTESPFRLSFLLSFRASLSLLTELLSFGVRASAQDFPKEESLSSGGNSTCLSLTPRRPEVSQ